MATTPHANPSNPASTTPLLSLPLELRQQIYSYLLKPGYIIIHNILSMPASAQHNENGADAAAAATCRASILDADLLTDEHEYDDPHSNGGRRSADWDSQRNCTPTIVAVKGMPLFSSSEPATLATMTAFFLDLNNLPAITAAAAAAAAASMLPGEKHLITAILRVCRQTHAEAAHLLYASNMFDFVEKREDLDMKDCWWDAQERKRVRMFLDMIGPLNASLIRRVGISCPNVRKKPREPGRRTHGVPALDPITADTVDMLRRRCSGLCVVEMPLTGWHPLVEAVRPPKQSGAFTGDGLRRHETEACVGLIDHLFKGPVPGALPPLSTPGALDLIVIPINQMQPQDQKLHDEMRKAGWKMGRDLVMQRKIGWALRRSKIVVMNPSWAHVSPKLLYS